MRYVGIRFTFLVQKFLLVFRYPLWSPDNCEAFFQPLLTLILGSIIPPPSVPCGIKWRYEWLIPSTGSWTSEGLGLWHERKKSGMKAHEDEDSWGLCHWRNTISLTWSFSGGLICEEASKTFNIEAFSDPWTWEGPLLEPDSTRLLALYISLLQGTSMNSGNRWLGFVMLLSCASVKRSH